MQAACHPTLPTWLHGMAPGLSASLATASTLLTLAMAEGASGSRRGRGGARKRDYKQLNALVQLAEGTGQAVAAPGSVYYVRADSTLVSEGKLEACGAAALLPLALAAPSTAVSCSLIVGSSSTPPTGVAQLPSAGLNLPAWATVAEHKDGGDSDTSIDAATLVARSTAWTFTLNLPAGLQVCAAGRLA